MFFIIQVSYLDTGLASTYFTEADKLVVPPTCSPSIIPVPVTPTRTTRKYKTQFKKKRKQKSQSGQASLFYKRFLHLEINFILFSLL